MKQGDAAPLTLLNLRVRHLDSDHELQTFADGFREAIQKRTQGVVKGEIPIDYLRASRVTGVFDRQGRMVAGYVIGTRTPLRLLEFVPPEARRALVPPGGASWDDCCEITCFWRLCDVSRAFMALRLWPRLLVEAIRTRKRFILGHSQSARLDALYSNAPSLTLYAGPSVASLPSRLSAYEARGFWHQALRGYVVEGFRRLVKARRSSE